MRVSVAASLLALTLSVAPAHAQSLGNGAIVDRRPLTTPELMLMCWGQAKIPMDKLTQQLSCLHYVQGFLDSHVVLMGYMKNFEARGMAGPRLPQRSKTCVDLNEVKPETVMRLLQAAFNPTTDEGRAKIDQMPYAHGAILSVLFDNFPCKN